MISVVLLSFLFSSFVSVQSVDMMNCAEMTTALSTIPVDIAARRCDLQGDKKTAAVLYMLVDSISFLNKIFFAYNNKKIQRFDTGSWTSGSRDFLANGMLALRDMTKFFQHSADLWASFQSETTQESEHQDKPVENTIVLLFDENDKNTVDDNLIDIEQELSRLGYSWRVHVLPILKGLTAFMLAFTQNTTSLYATKQARCAVTAAHFLSRLLDEYTMLKADSSYRRLIATAIIYNAIWLVYEFRQLHQQIKSRSEQLQVAVDCTICYEHTTDYVTLPCGHQHHRACLGQHVNQRINDRRPFINCPENRCNHNINGDEVRLVGDRALLDAYAAAFQAMEEVRERARQNAYRNIWIDDNTQRCPGCDTAIQKNGGCNHITCRGQDSVHAGCGHQFCWVCRQPWHGGNPSPGCNHQFENVSLHRMREIQAQLALDRLARN